MGWAKEYAMEIEERGFSDIDKYICSECVEDDFLKQWIDKNATETKECDYCGRTHSVVLMTDLMKEVLMPTFKKYYWYANDHLGWDGREGGYQGTTYDTEYVVNNFAEEISSNQQVLDDVVEAIGYDQAWCDEEPYGLTERERREYSWKSFSDLVKYKNRYFFFDEENDEYHEKYTPLDILYIISEQAKKLDIIKTITQNFDFYRVRIFSKKDDLVLDGANLGAPPKECAQTDRMSACGISSFYASDDIETSLKEIQKENSDNKEFVAVGQFKNLRDLKCLDLTAINEIKLPSIFDLEKYDEREAIFFLKGLNKELTRPIKDLQPIEYVPTQIFAEYFKLVQKLDGIKYNSSKNKNGTCYVLFFSNEQCIENKKNILGEDLCQLKLVKAYNL